MTMNAVPNNETTTMDTDMTFKGITIGTTRDKLISLTDMWKACGANPSKKPAMWLRNDGTMEFVKAVARKLKVAESHLLKTRSGRRHGGTYAHWQISMAYAKYLSPEFHIWCNQVIRERFEEDADPELGISRARQRAVNSWKKLGHSEEWIETRLSGMESRKMLVSELGRTRGNFAQCTNAVYEGLFGCKAKDLRERLNTDNPRNAMSEADLLTLSHIEGLGAERLKEERLAMGECLGPLVARERLETLSRQHSRKQLKLTTSLSR